MKVTSLEDAKGALQCGLDGLVVEAPQGPNRITPSLMSLLPEIVDAVRLPVIASGNIADGRSLAASLTLGAEAVRIGTPFLAAVEADAEAEYERRFGPSSIEGTALVELFSREWPEEPAPAANSRSTQTRVYTEVENRPVAAGPIPADEAAAEHGLTLTKLTRVLSTEREVVFEQDDFEGNEKKETKVKIRAAAEIIREMTGEAEQILARYAPLVAVA
jgi:NAD(P)H-dependent flavin oxidoreductase YrpB (nitropropane dioxygenase family)